MISMLNLIRNILGEIIVLLNALFKPKQIQRSSDEQTQIDDAVSGLALYQFRRCPFCVKVRREFYRLKLPIKLCDVNTDDQYRHELSSQGGKVKVPCLKISDGSHVRWLYESSDIVNYVNQKFALNV